MHIVKGNLLDATEQYIVQQCNCISTRSHGLSKQVAERFRHADVYGARARDGAKNTAPESARAVPGTIAVLGDGDSERFVICAFAQYGMGKPYSLNNSNRQWIDDHKSRALWFGQCLQRIAELEPTSVAFPYMIGCGLAGGDWDADYYPMLQKFCEENPKVRAVMYRL
jgi:O-acetyl-ADP-ribose deacetylase (regulator of RNase III)